MLLNEKYFIGPYNAHGPAKTRGISMLEAYRSPWTVWCSWTKFHQPKYGPAKTRGIQLKMLLNKYLHASTKIRVQYCSFAHFWRHHFINIFYFSIFSPSKKGRTLVRKERRTKELKSTYTAMSELKTSWSTLSSSFMIHTHQSIGVRTQNRVRLKQVDLYSGRFNIFQCAQCTLWKISTSEIIKIKTHKIR